MTNLETAVMKSMERLCKWRVILASWQCGMNNHDSPEFKAVEDHRELTLLMRAELNAIVRLLTDKGFFTIEEWQRQMLEESGHLNKAIEGKFPGLVASDNGVIVKTIEAEETMKTFKQ